MLNKIIQYSLHNRLVVMIASIALLLWGSYTAHKMEVDVFPDLNAPTVVVMTEAQGMAPEEVESGYNLIGVPIFTRPVRSCLKNYPRWEMFYQVTWDNPPLDRNLPSWEK